MTPESFPHRRMKSSSRHSGKFKTAAAFVSARVRRMIRESGYRFSLDKRGTRLLGDHAPTDGQSGKTFPLWGNGGVSSRIKYGSVACVPPVASFDCTGSLFGGDRRIRHSS